MANANVVALQNATNRYASSAGFSLLVADGGMGINTANALLRALGWIVRDGCGPHDVCVSATTKEQATALLSSIINDSGAIDQTKIMQSNVGMTLFLNTAANTIGLPYAAAPTPVVAQGQAASGGMIPPGTMIYPASGMSVSLIDRFKMMPTWQKVLLGAIAGLGVLWAHKKLQQRGGLSGFHDAWLKDPETGELVRRATAHEVEWYRHKGRVDLPNHVSRGGKLRRYDVVNA